MKLSIREAIPTDAEVIAKVLVETWQDAYLGLIPDDYLANLSISERTKVWKKNLTKKEDNTLTLIGCVENKVLAWASFGHSRDDDSDNKRGELWGIYVHPTAQGKKLGSMLMFEGIAFLKKKGYSSATLWVLTTNKKTRKYYEAKGWKIEGKVKIAPRKGFELHETRYVIDL